MEPPGKRAGAMRNYAVTHMVGEGSFGRVYKARKRGTGETVALKRIAKAGRSEKEISSLRQEIDILSRLTHPNIVQMVELVETTSELCVITEFAHGELFEVIEDDQCLPEPEVQTIAQQLTRALHYLHSNSIIHRDMKPQNILIGTNKRVMLCDFGFARAMSSTTIVLTSIKGTPLYMAPELVQEKPYDLTVDLWSLGVILYELYMGKPPFYTNNIYGLIQHIIKDHIHFPTSVSNAFKSFLQGLLMKKPSERLTWPDLLHHPFVHLEGSVTEPTPPRLVAQPHTSYPTSSPAPSTVDTSTQATASKRSNKSFDKAAHPSASHATPNGQWSSQREQEDLPWNDRDQRRRQHKHNERDSKGFEATPGNELEASPVDRHPPVRVDAGSTVENSVPDKQPRQRRSARSEVRQQSSLQARRQTSVRSPSKRQDKDSSTLNIPEVGQGMRANADQVQALLDILESTNDAATQRRALDALTAASDIEPASHSADQLGPLALRWIPRHIVSCMESSGRQKVGRCAECMRVALRLASQVGSEVLHSTCDEYVRVCERCLRLAIDSNQLLERSCAMLIETNDALIWKIRQAQFVHKRTCKDAESLATYVIATLRSKQNTYQEGRNMRIGVGSTSPRSEHSERGNGTKTHVSALLMDVLRSLHQCYSVASVAAHTLLQNKDTLRELVELVRMRDSRALQILNICCRSSARVSQSCSDHGLPQILKPFLQAHAPPLDDALSACQTLNACIESNKGASSLSILLEEGLTEQLIRLLSLVLRDDGCTKASQRELVQMIAKLLQLPFASQSPPEQAMIEYQKVLENEYAISLFTEALATIDQDALQLPMGLLTRLVLCNSAFAQQFEHAGGLHDAIVSRLLDPVNNTSSLLVDALLAMSQLARMSKDVYPQLESAHVCEHLSNLIRHGDASVRARACNLIGNLCRHSEYFYSKLKKTGLITELIERCQDEDMATQKFACFALGNAGFHTDTLYKYLKAAVPVLTAHLASDDPKTRANAAGALGNFARNSNDLCSELTSAGAVEGLARIVSDHARRLKEGASEGESQKKRSGSREAALTREESSPVKIALFSLGNLCTHSVCRERLWEHIDVADVMSIIREKSCDTAVQKYSGRIEHKYGQKT